jgi:hypothetical protein
MTKRIRQYKEVLQKANNKPWPEIEKELTGISEKLSVKLPNGLSDRQREALVQLNAGIHDMLQTEMMLNACVYAKWSCICAAVAAIVACISVILPYVFKLR